MQLGRRGIGTNEEKEGIDDSAFLMEVMEAREEIEDLDEPEALQSLKSQYLRKQSGIIQVQNPEHARQFASHVATERPLACPCQKRCGLSAHAFSVKEDHCTRMWHMNEESSDAS